MIASSKGLRKVAALTFPMPATLPKLGALFSLMTFLLISTGQFCSAQSATPNTTSGEISAESSTALPDAPTPQNDTKPATPGPAAKPEDITFAGLPRRLLTDQKAIWTSPLHIRPLDAVWLLPLAATTGVLIGSDQHTMTSLININAADQKHFSTLSDAGVGALGALPAGMYLWSLGHDAPQAHETSLLTGEALVDSLAVNQVFKLISRRDRPTVNDAQGQFFNSSFTNSSFPSD